MPPWRAETLELADIVDKAEELPLCIDLTPGAQAKALKAVGAGDVGENRLNDAESPGVLIAAVLGVDLALHRPRGAA